MLILLAWIAVGFWNAVKPLPPGTRVASMMTRLQDSDLEFLVDRARDHGVLSRQLALIDGAEQLVVLDQSPLPRELAQALLLRKHLKPKLKVVVLTDPKNELLGGTRTQDLSTLERAGIIVARIRLERLRDANPLYSGLWRLTLSWWSDPFTEAPGGETLLAAARQLNYRADQRQVLVADDGAGGFLSIIGAADASPAILMRGAPARDVVASELALAAWSTDEDRLPAVPPPAPRGVGTIDVRFLSEGAIAAALLDTVSLADRGDELTVAAHSIADRRVIDALRFAVSRGARVLMLLDALQPNHFAADDLLRSGVELRWQGQSARRAQLALLHHHGDVVAVVSAASLTRRDLGDFNLVSGVELRMPERAAIARAATEFLSDAWLHASPASVAPSGMSADYWLNRLTEAAGLAPPH